jgi:DNA repair exonuclease SbcCD nuclease subunit
MKISVLSDFHFGFGLNTEMENDSFEAAKECVEKSLDCDLIIIAGDVFDSRVPTSETLAKSMEIFSKPLLKNRTAKLIDHVGKDRGEISPMALFGTPVVAIHGTHERRVKGFLNPIELLEKAGFLIHLHCNGVVFQKGGEKVCVQGLSGVPDQYAESIMEKWDPKPMPECFNIFMLHQSVSPYIYADHTLDANKLPKGFDLYICGHIHEPKKTMLHGAHLLLPGSTIPTQLNKESTKPRGFWKIEITKPGCEISWIELENQRRVYYETFEKEADLEEVEKRIDEILKEDHKKKPIIRVNIKGKMLVEDLREKFKEKAIISFKKDIQEEILPLKTLEEHKLSVQELGRKLLLDNLKNSGLDPMFFENIFELLAHNKSEEVVKLLMKKDEKT